MAGSLYTPFMATGAKAIAGGIRDRRERARDKAKNLAASKAYMGDPTALQDLAAMDPELAMKVEDQAGQRKQRQQQTALHEANLETQRRKWAAENKGLMEELTARIGAFDDYEMARNYAAEEVAQIQEIMGPDQEVPLGELTPEQFEQFKHLRQVVTGDDWEKSGGPELEIGPDGKPRRVQTFINPKTKETETVPVSLGVAITGHDPEQAAKKKRAVTEAATEEERAQIAIDAGTAAAATLPNVNRALQLLGDTETAGWKEYANQLQQFVGYEGEETADLAELQQLLAAQMFDTLSNFRGAISNTELATARQLSTGLGKNTEANKRILVALQQRLGRAVDIAKVAANERGDMIALQMLEEFDPFAAGGDLFGSADPTGGDTAGGGAPEVGTVVDGYRFTGGDPADSNNWEPAGG